eukprot:COSAG01_NODE_22781_length_841_cov_1.227763_1_plen_62_part_00
MSRLFLSRNIEEDGGQPPEELWAEEVSLLAAAVAAALVTLAVRHPARLPPHCDWVALRASH